VKIATGSEVVTSTTLFDRCRTALFAVAASAVLSLTFVTAAHAAPIVITFDPGDPIGGLPVGSTLSNQYAAVGVTFSPNGFTGSGSPTPAGPSGVPTGEWATNTDMTIVSSTGLDVGGLDEPPLVSGNVLRSFSGWLSENSDASFRASFSTPVSFFSATFAGIADPALTRLFVYNGATLLGTVSATSTGQQTLSFNGSTAITSVVLTPGSFFDYVAVDDITFDPFEVVPEPTSMVLVGAGLAGAIARRRRRR
jgi:hypothetical protein